MGWLSQRNFYTNKDTDMQNIQNTEDLAIVGHLSSTLKNYYNLDSPPQLNTGYIEIGDINSARELFDISGAISTTDPFTSLTVADGDVYIVVTKSGGTTTAALTATAPTWFNASNYWGASNRRYLPWVITKSGASYTNPREIYTHQYSAPVYDVSDATERTQTLAGENVIPGITLTITSASAGRTYGIIFKGEFKSSTSGAGNSAIYLKSSSGVLSGGNLAGEYYGAAVPGYMIQSDIYPDDPVIMEYRYFHVGGPVTIQPYWFQKGSATSKVSKNLRLYAYQII